MFARYRAVFAAPGSAAFCVAALVCRFSVAIYPIGLVLIVSARTGHYGFAGVVSGGYVFGGALGNPLAGRLVDRYGQSRILLPFVALHVAAVVVFAVLLRVRTPEGLLLVPGAVMGFSLINFGALVRARWSYVYAEQAPRRGTAYSLESSLDELTFVLGPLVATVTATHAPAEVPLGIAVGLTAAGSLWLARQRRTEPPVVTHEGRRASSLATRGMVLLTASMVGMGAVFGAGDVVMVAFCGQHGQRGSSGWVLASFAAGSAVAGMAYGARHWSRPIRFRLAVASALFGLLPLVWFAARSVPELAGCAFVIGLAVAPTLIGAFGLIEEIVPPAMLTEGLTWVGTGLSVGYGAGAAAVGGIADAHGARVAFWVPVAAALGTAALVQLLVARLRTPGPAASQPLAVG